jgi:hypothetical protein
VGRKAKRNSLAVSAMQENSLINVALHHTGKPDCPPLIPYSMPICPIATS